MSSGKPRIPPDYERLLRIAAQRGIRIEPHGRGLKIILPKGVRYIGHACNLSWRDIQLDDDRS